MSADDTNSNDQMVNANLTFLCSLHLDEVQRRRKEANFLAVTTLLALIVLSSLALGNAQRRSEGSRISGAAGKLKDLVEANRGVKALNMAQLLSLKEDVRVAALDLTNLVRRQSGAPAPEFLKDLDLEGTLETTNVKPSQVLNDLSTLVHLQERYADMPWAVFKKIPEKTETIILFPHTIPAPSQDLKTLIDRYGVHEQIAWPPGDVALTGPTIGVVLARVMSIRIRNDAALGRLEKLLAWDRSALLLPISAFRVRKEEVVDAYESLAGVLGLRDLKSEIYVMEGGKPKPESTEFGTLYGRLLRMAEERLAALEKQLSLEVYGTPVRFPVEPIVFLLPLVMPIYLLAVVALRAAKTVHLRIASTIENRLRRDAEKEIRGLSSRVRGPGGWLMRRLEPAGRWATEAGNLQFLALQMGIGAAYAYLLGVAIEISFTVPLMKDAKGTGIGPLGSSYLALILCANVLVIPASVALWRYAISRTPATVEG